MKPAPLPRSAPHKSLESGFFPSARRDPGEEDEIVVTDDGFGESFIDECAQVESVALPPLSEASFERVVTAIAEVGGVAEQVGIVRRLLAGRPAELGALPPPSTRGLAAFGLATVSGGAVVPTAELSLAAAAWKAILDGTSSELSSCGEWLLDEWAARVAAGLRGESRFDAARAELRKRGIVAFGLLEA